MKTLAGQERRGRCECTRWGLPLVATALVLCPLVCRGEARAFVRESSRQLPVTAVADVVVVGGTVGGVAAAAACAGEGVAVYLVAPRPYLGEDLCATLRLERRASGGDETPLEARIFAEGSPARPAHVKATLDRVLLDAGVQFGFGSFVTDVLRDADGHPAGVVVANRAGRQAIVAKLIVDATDYAWVCRQAGCGIGGSWRGGPVRFERTVLDAERSGSDGGGSNGKRAAGTYVRRTIPIEIHMPDFSYASLAGAEQTARDATYADSIQLSAEQLFCVPPNPIACRRGAEDFVAGAVPDVAHFQPRDQDRLYVLGGCADIPRAIAAEVLRPCGLARIGDAVGRDAATRAKVLSAPSGVHLPGDGCAADVKADVRELLGGASVSSVVASRIPAAAGDVPVLADVDVVVIGGGTAGAPAAIGAAREGLRVLVVEYQSALGGVGTMGLIGKPYHGRKAGFARDVPFPTNAERKMEWYRTQLRKAGGTSWCGVLGCGALVEGRTVKGAVVCTPQGRGVVRAAVVIDATGSGDVAIGAGAAYLFGATEDGDIAMQGTGLPVRAPGDYYRNSDFLLVDETDMQDVWRAFVGVQLRQQDAFDVGTFIQSRERRRVVTDFVMRYIDQLAGRTYADTVVFSGSDYDSHGYPNSIYFALLPHDAQSRKANHPAPGGTCYTPYRCLLPRDLDGILVVGLGIGMTRDATALVRMQLDIANQGYAAGRAAALAVRDGVSPRCIDVRELQKRLVHDGCLPAEVLEQKDAFPLSAGDVRQAVADYTKARNPRAAGRPLAIIMAHPELACEPLHVLYADPASTGEVRLRAARVLAVLGDRSVVPTLVAALDAVPAWDAKIFQGNMADYAYLPTPVDGLVLSLGYAGDESGARAILRMVRLLDSGVTLSHHRSVALALERLRDPRAAEALVELLRKPGMQGYALTALPRVGAALEPRTESLRELTLARALYRCGDVDGLGRRILEQYCRDWRGLFARHARAVLDEAGPRDESGL